MAQKIPFFPLSILLPVLLGIWHNQREYLPTRSTDRVEVAALPVIACDTTFLKIYGTPTQKEFGHALVPVPGGGFLLGGGRGTRAMISLFDDDANLIWARTFDATSDADDYIWDIELDSDGNLIGVGQTRPLGGNVEVFAFKYDWQNNNFLWVSELDIADPALEGYFTMLEKAPGGNYIIAGQTTPPGSPVSSALLLEVDRNDGSNVWDRQFSLAGGEIFYKTILHNGALYATGEFQSPGTGDQIRPGITRLDLNGNQIWTKLYIVPATGGATARLRGRDILADNGLVVFGYGNKTGGGVADNTLFLFKTNTDGSLEWTKEYAIPSASTVRATRLVNVPDGYLWLGFYELPGGGSDIFIFKTNKSGEKQWSKRYDGTFNNDVDEAYDMAWKDDFIYCTGKTTNGADEDVFLARLKGDGVSGAPGNCNLFSDLNMTETTWTNPYQGQHDLVQSQSLYGFFADFAVMAPASLQQSILCLNPCDSCEFKPDAVFQNAFAECAGDSLAVTLTICNEGFTDFPEGAYVSFYSGNPTAGLAPLIGLHQTPQAIEPDSCLIFSVKIPYATPPVFIVVNDQGTFPQPIDLAGAGPTTDIEECDFTNNIGMLDMAGIPSPLDLGPDTLGCPGDTLLLTASGFDSYEWFPKNLFACDTCASQFVVPQPDIIFEIIVTASTDDACFSVDTISVGATERVFTFDTAYFCPGDTVLVFGQPVTEPGEYTGVFPRPEGCDSTHQISLKTASNLLLQLPADLTIELGDSIRLDPLTNGLNLAWQWSPPDGLSCDDCQRPWARPFETTRYTLTVTDENGCDATGEMLLTVPLNRRVFIPNAFSPNGDGINDVFLVFAGGNVARVRSFQLFDRWGEKIFEDFNFPPNDPAHGWDGFFKGKLMNPAVFVYKAEVEYVDGEVEVFRGDVALLR
jgi:gliding motility-associated-like protein